MTTVLEERLKSLQNSIVPHHHFKIMLINEFTHTRKAISEEDKKLLHKQQLQDIAEEGCECGDRFCYIYDRNKDIEKEIRILTRRIENIELLAKCIAYRLEDKVKFDDILNFAGKIDEVMNEFGEIK
jgi:hypothetical protein